jgi:hypothetical protein
MAKGGGCESSAALGFLLDSAQKFPKKWCVCHLFAFRWPTLAEWQTLLSDQLRKPKESNHDGVVFGYDLPVFPTLPPCPV